MRAEQTEKLGSGLLVKDQEAERAGRPVERRVEEWLVWNLEGKSCKNASTVWDEMLGAKAGAGLRRLSKKEERQAAKDGDWGRFRLSESKGIATIRLTDSMLIKEQVIQEFTDDFLELINAGYDRVILNFSEVERLSVQVVLALAEGHLRCASALGGMLKLCGLRPEIAEGLALTGLAQEVGIYGEESEARDSDWPTAGLFRPLPVNILSIVRLYQEVDANEDLINMPGLQIPPTAEPEARLVLVSGPSAGRSLKIGQRRVVIGRDEGTTLRIVAPSVSRIHAAVEWVGSRLLLQDLGSTNGTRWNEKLVQNRTVELQNGDCFTIGPVQLRVEIGAAVVSGPVAEPQITDWIRKESGEVLGVGAQTTSADLPVPSELISTGARTLSVERIQGAIVLTPLTSQLDEEPQIAPLREELQAIGKSPMNARVVVDLRNVSHISSKAIGLLVAYALKLEREGGELRLSQISPRVMAVVNQIRLPMLIEIYPTTDEAVLCVWRNSSARAGVAG